MYLTGLGKTTISRTRFEPGC